MKLKILPLMILTLLFCSCGSGEDVPSETGEGVLSSFSATDLDGGAVDQTIFADFDLTMVNIWGTFCAPCIREMPGLAELNLEYADQSFQVIGIIIDAADRNFAPIQDKLTDARVIIAATQADYAHLLPSESLNDALLADIQAVPYTIFVNSEGCQVGESFLGARTKQSWQEIIDALLKAHNETPVP